MYYVFGKKPCDECSRRVRRKRRTCVNYPVVDYLNYNLSLCVSSLSLTLNRPSGNRRTVNRSLSPSFTHVHTLSFVSSRVPRDICPKRWMTTINGKRRDFLTNPNTLSSIVRNIGLNRTYTEVLARLMRFVTSLVSNTCLCLVVRTIYVYDSRR